MSLLKRILFVDDDPLVLALLRRQLRPQQAEWDMEYAEGAMEALAVMGRQPVDVVISDLRMPGMNGAELLQEAMRRHPQTIRLILSGEIDPRLVLHCVGCAHQFLAKPFDLEALRTTIQRLETAASSINNEALRRLITSLDDIPSIPTLYTEIVEKLQLPDTTLEDIGRLIARDPAMTAKMLKLTNSAFFGLRREVLDIADAVAYLGVDIVVSLVLVFHVFSLYEGCRLEGFSIDALWTHSLDVASRSRNIAMAEGASAQMVNAACVSGLLHDVGKLILAANAPTDYQRVLAESAPDAAIPLEVERRILGATHADVGGYLLGLWGLPVPVVEAITLHHTPREYPREEGRAETDPVLIVHVADALIHSRSASGETRPSAPLDLELLSGVRLRERLDIWRRLD
jgi:HD-like signal output (HDOD) protein/CheY-like chemotaxis protein